MKMINWIRKLSKKKSRSTNMRVGLRCQECKFHFGMVEVDEFTFHKSLGVIVLCQHCYKKKTRVFV